MAIGFTNITSGGGLKGLTATPGDVKMGLTFTTDSKNLQTGTMNLTNLKPENIKKGVNITGIIGELESIDSVGNIKGYWERKISGNFSFTFPSNAQYAFIVLDSAAGGGGGGGGAYGHDESNDSESQSESGGSGGIGGNGGRGGASTIKIGSDTPITVLGAYGGSGGRSGNDSGKNGINGNYGYNSIRKIIFKKIEPGTSLIGYLGEGGKGGEGGESGGNAWVNSIQNVFPGTDGSNGAVGTNGRDIGESNYGTVISSTVPGTGNGGSGGRGGIVKWGYRWNANGEKGQSGADGSIIIFWS